MTKRLIFLALALISMSFGVNKAQNQYKMGLVGFYNLENLFDTINDPNIDDEEFLPEEKNRWNTEKYNTKLHNLAYAISTMVPTNQKDSFTLPTA